MLDTANGTRWHLPWPHTLGRLDAPAADPSGRFVAIAFASPSCCGGTAQALDVWLLDTTNRKLTHLPGMPARVALKETNMAWTHDGRLIFLAKSDGRHVVAVWRPGEKNLAVKIVKLPDRHGGNDSFAPVG